ncbi:unnamed protein product [Rotaria socialis]
MPTVSARRASIIISTEDSANTYSNDASSIRSSTKDDNISLTSMDNINSKNGRSNGRNYRQENPTAAAAAAAAATASSSSTTDSDMESEQDDPVKEEEKNKHKKNRGRLSRREKYFRKMFASEIPDPMPKLIDYYLCAYQGDILLQGKMFITDRYLCFYSKIINYVTKHVYRWDNIERITKERVAYIFPTAIRLKLKDSGKRVIYASFLSRDLAYDKITSIWPHSSNNNNLAADDENRSSRKKTLKRNSCESVQISEPDEVLEHCLNDPNSNRRRGGSVSPRRMDEEKTLVPLINSSVERPRTKYLTINPKTSNQANGNNNKNTRPLRCIKNERDEDNTTTKRSRTVNNRLQDNSSSLQPSQTIDQALSVPEQPISHSKALPPVVVSNTSPSIRHINDKGISTKAFNVAISFINLIIQTLSSLFHRFHIYPTKATTFIFICMVLVFMHSFYLIALAYRLENRLQTLHNRWPSSLMKNSFSSNSKQL